MHDLDFAFYSDIGGRENNEDAYLVKRISNGCLFIVADGLGGHSDGEIASCTAIHSIKDYLINNNSDDVLEAIKYANSAILDLQKKSNTKMKTTIALVYIMNDKSIIAHTGDSRVYAFKQGSIVYQSTDHSASQLAVTLGEIKLEDIRNHEDRNVLLQALGARADVKVDIYEIDNFDYDALLLCSDGFWEYVLENEMEKCLENSNEADKWLYKMRAIQLNRAPEKCDNNTAIAVLLS